MDENRSDPRGHGFDELPIPPAFPSAKQMEPLGIRLSSVVVDERRARKVSINIGKCVDKSCQISFRSPVFGFGRRNIQRSVHPVLGNKGRAEAIFEGAERTLFVRKRYVSEGRLWMGSLIAGVLPFPDPLWR